MSSLPWRLSPRPTPRALPPVLPPEPAETVPPFVVMAWFFWAPFLVAGQMVRFWMGWPR